MGDYADWDIEDRIDGNPLPYDCGNRKSGYKKQNFKPEKQKGYTNPTGILWKIRNYAKAEKAVNEEFTDMVNEFARNNSFEWEDRNNGASQSAVMYMFVWKRREAFKQYFEACITPR
ncbi:MAG: hypothetical protein ACRCXN_12940 [Bacteroidales bacterium]